jgi:hypothetical protein
MAQTAPAEQTRSLTSLRAVREEKQRCTAIPSMQVRHGGTEEVRKKKSRGLTTRSRRKNRYQQQQCRDGENQKKATDRDEYIENYAWRSRAAARCAAPISEEVNKQMKLRGRELTPSTLLQRLQNSTRRQS